MPRKPKQEVVEDRSAFNCPTCHGEGLVGTNFQVAGKHELCPDCGGSGKKVE